MSKHLVASLGLYNVCEISMEKIKLQLFYQKQVETILNFLCSVYGTMLAKNAINNSVLCTKAYFHQTISHRMINRKHNLFRNLIRVLQQDKKLIDKHNYPNLASIFVGRIGTIYMKFFKPRLEQINRSTTFLIRPYFLF